MRSTDIVEGAKIVGLTIVASVAYGIVHDLITVRICLEYFTVSHPDIFHTTNPTLLALGWGVVATWWMGAIFGSLIAAAARCTPAPKLTWRDALRPICLLLTTMAMCAFLAGLVGSRLTSYTPVLGPPGPEDIPAGTFYSVLFAHNASYDVGGLGAIAVAMYLIVRRMSLQKSGDTTPTSTA